MHFRLARAAFAAGVVSLFAVAAAEAQPVGTFRWQLQPFADVVTVNVTQQGGSTPSTAPRRSMTLATSSATARPSR